MDVQLTFSTADNSPPPEVAPPRVTTVRLGVLLPMFGTQSTGSPDLAGLRINSSVAGTSRVGVYQALREIENKSDGGESLSRFERTRHTNMR